MSVGSEDIEEVLQGDLRDILKPGKSEDKVCEVILWGLGGWTSPAYPGINDSSFPAIKTAEFKCFTSYGFMYLAKFPGLEPES